MEFLDLVKKRRSVRQFKDEAIPEDKLNTILEAALWAPSAGNTRCARFFVVRDADTKKRLASEAGHQLFIAQAPVAIVVAADLEAVEKGYGERGRSTYALQDAAAATQNIMLAAADLGYGSCWVGAFEEIVASKILGLPGHVRPLAIVPIGVPNEPTVRVPPHKKIEDVVKIV
jgi:nitroreductase